MPLIVSCTQISFQCISGKNMPEVLLKKTHLGAESVPESVGVASTWPQVLWFYVWGCQSLPRVQLHASSSWQGKIDELGGFWLGQLGQVGVSCFISACALKQPCSDPKIQLQFFLRGAISCDCMTEGYKGWCYVGYPLV